MRSPLDPTPYPKHPHSRPITPELPNGNYVYVVDQDGVIWTLRDGPHRHPLVLGNGQPARYAGDFKVTGGVVVDLTNLSGTFLFDDEAGLREVAEIMRQAGIPVQTGAVRFFPVDGVTRPYIVE